MLSCKINGFRSYIADMDTRCVRVLHPDVDYEWTQDLCDLYIDVLRTLQEWLRSGDVSSIPKSFKRSVVKLGRYT